MRITSVSSTYCFVDLDGQPGQVVRVAVADAPSEAGATVSLEGQGFRSPTPWRGQLSAGLAGRQDGPAWAPGTDPGLAGPGRFTPSQAQPEGVVVEVPVLVEGDRAPGTVLRARARAEAGGEVAEAEGDLVVREPGWRMIMVPHFHYDPVWWNTQAGYTSSWDELLWAQERRETFQHTGLTLVEAHLQRARVDPAYKFVLAEVDYLKPFWDLYPDRRAELRALIDAGRLEIVGGTYNEPNTNLTGAETAIRSAVYGIGFQRDVMGADPQSAWQLDVFGHDPQFPGIMAECGLTSSAWARGPFHQWGPHQHTGSNSWMQFPSEFEWVAPNGKGLLTSYMPNHYSSGWELERATTLEGAMWRAYELFCSLAEVSAARVTLLPVGTDYTPPSRFISAVSETWASRYVWPRFEVGLPREFFDAVRAELAAKGTAPSPQSRDMNPLYTGKDVSFIDTKQGQRLAEATLADAETLAAIANLLGAPVPYRAFDKAWRQLVFGAHHDGITGSESDQVYLDLVGGWRESYELAKEIEEKSRHLLVGAVDTAGDGQALVVTNTLGVDRSGLVEVQLDRSTGEVVEVSDASGAAVPVLSVVPEGDGRGNGLGEGRGGRARLQFRAKDVPGIGYRTYRLRATGGRPTGSRNGAGWVDAPGNTISNEHYEVEADPGRGGGITRTTDRSSGFEVVPQGEVGNEFVVYPEYPNHPTFGEGPWHLLPSGPPARSRTTTATVVRQLSPLGERLVVDGRLELGAGSHDDPPESFNYHQVITLWQGERRVDLRNEIHGWDGKDKLVRLRFPTTLGGATPVSAVGDAVVARGFGLIDVDSAKAPWTLDNPAAEWFGLSTTLLVDVNHGGDVVHSRSVGVAEIITARGEGGAAWARDLVVALVQKGVTATCSEDHRNRYGALLGDSNLPDFRIAVGGPADNAFVAKVLDKAGPAARAELENQMFKQGWARLLVGAQLPLADSWVPNADLRGPGALPVLVVAGRDGAATAAAVASLCREVESGHVMVAQSAGVFPGEGKAPNWTVALFNRGTPGFAVDASGALHVSLLRACTGWPSGVWIDPPRRWLADGSAFELEHWSHVFDHALFIAPGDWRASGCAEEAISYNRPLAATLTEPHAGVLPPQARLFAFSQDAAEGRRASGRAVVAALKPVGHPLATCEPSSDAVVEDRHGGSEPAESREITLRVYEALGSPAEVRVESMFELLEATSANLLEEPGDAIDIGDAPPAPGRTRGMSLELEPGEIVTARLRFGGPAFPVVAARPAASIIANELAQPVFSRYWLHNKGAAPLGNQALAVHAFPTAIAARAGTEVHFTAQVASGSARGAQSGTLELLGPDGWDIEPQQKLFSLAPGAFTTVDVRFRAPERTRPGRSFVAARVVDGSGQAQEDVVTVDILPPIRDFVLGDGSRGQNGDGGPAHPDDGQIEAFALPSRFAYPGSQIPAELEATLEAEELTVPAGAEKRAAVFLTNRTAGELRAEVQLISPFETWPLVTPWAQGIVLPPGQRRRAEVLVKAPVVGWLETWALFKVTYFGRLWYSPPVLLRLGEDARAPEGAQPRESAVARA